MAELFRKRPEAEKPSIDDIVNKNAISRLRKDPPGGQAGGNKGKDRIDDTDLIASMAKRLSLLEKDLRAKGRELERLQADNEALRSKLHVAEDEIAARASAHSANPSSGSAAPATATHSSTEEVAHLHQENQRLRSQVTQAWKQVADIKSFLNDYGMVWVGEGDIRRSSTGGQVPSPPRGGPAGPSAPVGARRISDNGAISPLPPRPPTGDGPAGHRSDVHRRSYTGAAAAPSAGATGTADAAGPSSHGSYPASPPGGMPFRMADLLARVEELNQLAGDGCGQLVPRAGKGPQAHVLHTPEPVRLTVFRDGIQLHRNAARPFKDPGVEAVLADILDGYFPAPLKADFPDGIPIKVIDRTRDSFHDALSPVNHPAMRAGQGNVRSFHDLESGEGAPMSRGDFLSKLPQAVIKNGKVIDVRGGVGKVMGGPDACTSTAEPSVSVVQTPLDALLTTSQRNHKGPVLPPPSREGGPGRGALNPSLSTAGQGKHAAGDTPVTVRASSAGATAGPSQAGPSGPDITTLQVKSEDGQHTFIVKLQYNDTIGALRKYINVHRAQQAKEAKTNDSRSITYEIRTAFPPRKYDNLSETLMEAGLVPNATLFLRAAS